MSAREYRIITERSGDWPRPWFAAIEVRNADLPEDAPMGEGKWKDGGPFEAGFHGRTEAKATARAQRWIDRMEARRQRIEDSRREVHMGPYA